MSESASFALRLDSIVFQGGKKDLVVLVLEKGRRLRTSRAWGLSWSLEGERGERRKPDDEILQI